MTLVKHVFDRLDSDANCEIEEGSLAMLFLEVIAAVGWWGDCYSGVVLQWGGGWWCGPTVGWWGGSWWSGVGDC